jgi:hypothetical protein
MKNLLRQTIFIPRFSPESSLMLLLLAGLLARITFAKPSHP